MTIYSNNKLCQCIVVRYPLAVPQFVSRGFASIGKLNKRAMRQVYDNEKQ